MNKRTGLDQILADVEAQPIEVPHTGPQLGGPSHVHRIWGRAKNGTAELLLATDDHDIVEGKVVCFDRIVWMNPEQLDELADVVHQLQTRLQGT